MNRTYLQALHSEVREELVRVDTKIGVLIRAFLVTASVVMAGAVAGDWNPATALQGLGEIVWWVGAAIVGVALGMLLNALSPITTHSEVRTELPRYFGDVRRFASRSDFRSALENADEESNIERLADQTFELSKLVSRKYGSLHWSIGLYVVGVVMAVVGWLL